MTDDIPTEGFGADNAEALKVHASNPALNGGKTIKGGFGSEGPDFVDLPAAEPGLIVAPAREVPTISGPTPAKDLP